MSTMVTPISLATLSKREEANHLQWITNKWIGGINKWKDLNSRPLINQSFDIMFSYNLCIEVID